MESSTIIDRLKSIRAQYSPLTDIAPSVAYINALDRAVSILESAAGLTPEEVAEYAKAKAEGRAVVLPCKVGDTVYFIKSCFSYAKSPMQGTVCMIKTFSESNTFTFGVIMENSSQERGITNFDIGKTVFLAREEAEKALKERENQ